MVIFLLFATFSYAVVGNVNSFYGQANPFNINLVSGVNQSFLLNIPQYSYATNVSLNLIGDVNLNLVRNYSYLIQGTWNTQPGSSAVDNDWSTKATSSWAGPNWIYINYTNSTARNYTTDRWEVKWATRDLNIYDINYTVPNGCINQSILQFRMTEYLVSGDVPIIAGCFNGTDWSIIFNDTAVIWVQSGIYEQWYKTNATLQSYRAIGTIYINNVATNFNTSTNLSLNITSINSLLSANQLVNITFASNISGTLQVNLTNASYAYGIDNCSNSFNIPSNVTTLNATFYDITNATTKVNLTTTITYADTYYTNANGSTFRYCIYPNWSSINANVQLKYIDTSGGVYYYQSPIIFNSSTYYLSLYATVGATTTTFTIKDKNTNNVLDSVLCTSYIQIGTLYQTVESKLSDITGKIIFNYLANNNYKFLCSKAGYNTLLFYLLPPSAAAYDVPMSPTTALNQTFDYDRISLTYSHGPFYNGLNNFTFIIGSLGELDSYGYTLTYPGGITTNSGTNSNGDALTSQITIVGATITDLVYFNYWYSKKGIGNKTFAPTFSIAVPATNYTMVANARKTYGLGLLERVLVSLLCVIVVVGLATLIGQPLMGFVMGLVILGFLTYLQFFPFWAGIISFIFGALFIFTRVEY